LKYRSIKINASAQCKKKLSYRHFTFNHLADAFILSDEQMRRAIEAIKPTIGQVL